MSSATGDRWSRRLANATTRHPGRVLVVALLLTLAAAAGMSRLQLRTDGRALVPHDSAAVVADREIREHFGVRDTIAVVIRADGADGIFNPDTLRRIEALTAALGGIEGLRPHDVTSLATERGFRRESGIMGFRGLLDPFPDSPELLERLRDDLRRIEVYDGTLVSEDGSSAAVLLDVPPGADRAELVRRIERLTTATGRSGSSGSTESVAVIGAPVAEALLGHHILADLGVPQALLGGDAAESSSRGGVFLISRLGMVPVAICVMGLVFLLAFRRWAAALLPLAEIGVCLAIVFGVMGWFGVPIYLTSAVLPVILAAVGIADEIHIFRRYLELGAGEALTDAEHRRVVVSALDEMAPPVVATSITTAIAFLSFALSPLAPVRAFGLFTALGVVVCMAFSLTVIPALLVIVGPRPWAGRKRSGASRLFSQLSVRLARFGSRHRVAVFVAVVAALVLSVDGLRRLEVQDSWIDGFAPKSAFARATRSFDRQFLGSHRLLLGLEFEAPALEGQVSADALGRHELRLPEPEIQPGRLEGSWIRLRQLGAAAAGTKPREWTTWIDSARLDGGQLLLTMPASGGSARSWLHPKTGETLAYEIRSEPCLAPSTLQRIDELETFVAGLSGVGGVLGPAKYLKTVGFMLQPAIADSRRLPADPKQARVRWSNYAAVRGAERRDQLVDREYRRALVAVFIRDADFAGTRRLLREVRDFEQQHLEPHGIRLTLGGDVAVSQTLIDAVVTTQVRSLALSLGGILIAAALLTGSLRRGIYCVLPPAFAVLANFAVMGWAGIPLGVATSMFASMTLGVGVDYAIHLLARHRRNVKRNPEAPGTALLDAFSTTGPAILIDALAVGLGFGILVLSQVPANARLGGLLVASMLGCLGATLFLLPALLARQSRSEPERAA